MVQFVLKPALLLSMIFALSALMIRAQLYNDRAAQALVQENCTAPCFITIRPGVTTMRRAVSVLESHEWVASGVRFPALVQNAVFFDAAVPRTRIGWRWSAEMPNWINTEQPGQLTLENREVQDLTIETRLLLGEIFIAFGNPDQAQLIGSSAAAGRRFEYSAWYTSAGMLISVEGHCPIWDYYHAPVRVLFRPSAPQLSGTVSKHSVCQ